MNDKQDFKGKEGDMKMIQILLNRLESLDGLKADAEKDLQVLGHGGSEEFRDAAEKLIAFIDVYKKTLSTFIHGETKKLTFEKYESHMKKHDDELFFLCNQYTFIKGELVDDQKLNK